MNRPPSISDDWFPRELPSALRMGEKSWLYGSFAFLHFDSNSSEAIEVGANSGIYHGTFFDLSGAAEVRIGDYCALVGVVFSTQGRISIGNYVFISHEVVFSDSQFAFPKANGAFKPQFSPSAVANIIVEDDVWIGAQAIITGNVTIGRGSIIGAASLVDSNVPPYSIFAGNPGRVVGELPAPSHPHT